MLKFPMKFEVAAHSQAGIANNWVAQVGHLPSIPSAIPPEFMGPGGGYSPEDLFGIAVINCLIATYKVYCEKANITFAEIKARAEVKVDKEPSSTSFHISQIDVFMDITGASDVDKAKKILESAIKDCAISNSIKSCKSFHINVI